jgi:hypothetical protein
MLVPGHIVFQVFIALLFFDTLGVELDPKLIVGARCKFDDRH